ncbi:ABC transporter permease [Streptomyces diastatochromogenes]|nr:ABC transporter permease [Streptomyces diastatochromogenes]
MISGRFLDLFTTFLLVFSGVAVLVSVFTIHNTFAVLVAQRTRENALLRAIGAARRQIVTGTLAEALAVGLLASLAGLLTGIGVAAGLQALFPAIGFPFPEGALVVSAGSLLLPLGVGLAVCASPRSCRPYGPGAPPARRAPRDGRGRLGQLPPPRADRRRPARHGRRHGPRRRPRQPVAVARRGRGGARRRRVRRARTGRRLARRTGPRPPLRGVNRGLARRNALRSPARTAATATALMIGVAVVTLFTVFGASLKTTMDRTVDRSFAGDVAIGTPSFGAGGSGLSPAWPRPSPRSRRSTPPWAWDAGSPRWTAGAARSPSPTRPPSPGCSTWGGTGLLTGLGTDGLAVAADEAAADGLAPGRTAELTFTDGSRRTFTVRAVYQRSDLAGDYLVTREAWAPHRTQDSDRLVAVSFADGVSAAQGKAAVTAVADRYGHPEVQTREEYAAASAGGIDMMLTLVYALLALAVLIALLGIANTLTLSVHERTRELGLLRAVGQTRAQLRAMVRWESVLVAAFGTVGGLALRAFLGWVLVRASGGSGDSALAFAVPGAPARGRGPRRSGGGSRGGLAPGPPGGPAGDPPGDRHGVSAGSRRRGPQPARPARTGRATDGRGPARPGS